MRLHLTELGESKSDVEPISFKLRREKNRTRVQGRTDSDLCFMLDWLTFQSTFQELKGSPSDELGAQSRNSDTSLREVAETQCTWEVGNPVSL